MIQGHIASRGIGIGGAYVLPNWEWNYFLPFRRIHNPDVEMKTIHQSIQVVKQELNELKNQFANSNEKSHALIFEAHLAILDDPMFIGEIQDFIHNQEISAAEAVNQTVNKFTHMLNGLEDNYWRERAPDIRDVGHRLLKRMLKITDQSLNVESPFILVAYEITPSVFAQLPRSYIQGMISTLGGTHSHVAIMARTLGIPYLYGIDYQTLNAIQQGQHLIVDGEKGQIWVNPDQEMREILLKEKNQVNASKMRKRSNPNAVSETYDKHRVDLFVNIHSIEELESEIAIEADGVGLFRTEYLFMNQAISPTEQEQFEIYQKAIYLLKGKPLVIRTLDIGGDKPLPYLNLPHERNPFLGYRAIRISLKENELFLTQLKAILRASSLGPVKIMFPFITSLSELQMAKKYLEIAKDQLRLQNTIFNHKIQIGINIEVPAAALLAEQLAKEVDFFSIGTNDLTQYVLAVDRMNEHVADLYDAYHPAVIRLIQITVNAAHKAGIGIGICGEVASHPHALPLWIGLGIKELSVSIHEFAEIKQRLRKISYHQSCMLVKEILQCQSSAEIISLLGNEAKNK